jgi:HEAT repeat protein
MSTDSGTGQDTSSGGNSLLSLATSVIAALVRRLGDPVPEVADAALAALVQFDVAALPPAVAACGDSDTERATRAVRLLGLLPDAAGADKKAQEALMRALHDERPVIRAEAANTLRILMEYLNLQALMYGRAESDGGTDVFLKAALAELCTACRDADPLVREAAATALGAASRVSPAIAEALQAALNDHTSRAVREAAARSLGKLADQLSGAGSQ